MYFTGFLSQMHYGLIIYRTMNRIVLIGNGFDLAHGLKTSYKDFIDDYWEGFMNHCIYQDVYFSTGQYKYDELELKMHIDQLLSHFLPYKENKYLLPNKQPASYSEFTLFINDFNQRYKNGSVGEIQFNISNKFLNHLLDISQDYTSWVDIENEYYKFLCGTFVVSTSNKYQLYYIEDLNPDFEHIKLKLNEYLLGILKENKVEKSDKIWDIIYSDIYLKDFTEVGQKDFATDEFSKIKRYISGISNEFDDLMSKKTKPLLNDYSNFDDDILKEILIHDLQNEERAKRYFELTLKNFLFLNFNYTDTEEIYTNNDDFNSEVIHIHGELNNPKNPIIFGYGDEIEENYNKLENLQDNAYLENIKSIKYLETDNYKKMLNFINSDKYQVIILGHSCGNSDRTLLNTLFEHENCVSIKPYYYQYKDEKTGEIKDNYSDIVRNISRSFKDKKSMRDKVVNKMYTDWFSSDVKE